MKKITSNPTLALLTVGFGLFVVLAFAQKSASPEPSASPLRAVAEVAPPPSADNVDPSFHARLMALREQLKTTPDDTTALLQAARLEQDAHQLPAAADHYERYLALRPQAHQVWLDLANVLAGDGKWDEAQRASEEMLERYPDDPSAMYNLGAIHANQGRPDDARQWWTTVRDGSNATLAARAEASLAKLAGAAAAGPRPAPSAAPRANPHAALPMQPVVARRVSGLGTE